MIKRKCFLQDFNMFNIVAIDYGYQIRSRPRRTLPIQLHKYDIKSGAQLQGMWKPTYYIWQSHYGDVIMGAIAFQITSLTIVYSTVYSDADQRKHQSSASLAFVWGIHREPVNSPHK